MLIEDFRYRPEVDGLRAVAVLTVLFYHAGFGFPGGYVGVDVFFVISGYLITSLIWKDLESGTFTFARFWQRRARRILPPLVVTVFVALLAGWFLLLPADLASLGRSAAAQSVFGANIHFWLDSGYFSAAAEEKPLLHTWSLAVEEQFYFIAPFVFYLLFRLKPLRRSVLVVLGTGFVLSFVLSIYGVYRSPSATFYLLPTRAWELLAGSLLAFLPATVSKRAEILSVAGLLLILLPTFFYTKDTPFPGLAAAAPVLGTALIIGANNKQLTRVGTILASRPFVWIGLISYSLYLWHWLFLAFAKYRTTDHIPAATRAALVACSFAAAYLSYRFIETPFRSRRVARGEWSPLLFAAVSLPLIFIVGLMLIDGYPHRFAPESVRYAAAASDMAFTRETKPVDAVNGRFVLLGDERAEPTALVWGDSHAMAAAPALDQVFRERGIGARLAAHSATAPALGWFLPRRLDGLYKDAIPFGEAVISYVQTNRIKNVILVARWSEYSRVGTENADAFFPALLETVRRLKQSGASVSLMISVPAPRAPVPKILALGLTAPAPVAETDFTSEQLEALQAAGVSILNPRPRFWDGSRFVVERDGVSLYRDGNHVSATGARLMLAPFFRESLVFE